METLITPLISIVVPVYKVEKYIHRCIDSILNQTFSEYELILVDDGSPDDCGNICESYSKIFSKKGQRCIVIHQENGGLSAARNAGIEWSINNSCSEWITFIDSDDWIHPQYLESLFYAIKKESSTIAVGYYNRLKDICEEIAIDCNQSIKIQDIETFWVESRTNATVAWGKLYKKSLFQNIRYPIRRYHEDEFVTYKLLFQNNNIAIVNFPIYHYFVNTDSIMTSNYMKRLPDIKDAFKQHIDFFEGTEWKNAYRIEVEKYAESMSEAIWLVYKKKKSLIDPSIVDIRNELISFLKMNKKLIPIKKRKDIYIAAYPNRRCLIRIYGIIINFINNLITWRHYE